MYRDLRRMVMAALFAAFACVATMSIRIPTPGTGGYIHPGDAIVILAGARAWFFSCGDWLGDGGFIGRIFYLCANYICD